MLAVLLFLFCKNKYVGMFILPCHGYLAFGYIYKHLNRSLREHSDVIVWEHQRRRPAHATAPSDQGFVFRHL